MDRLICVLLAAFALACFPLRAQEPAQPVFFSMMFPQLMPGGAPERTPGEAVAL